MEELEPKLHELIKKSSSIELTKEEEELLKEMLGESLRVAHESEEIEEIKQDIR